MPDPTPENFAFQCTVPEKSGDKLWPLLAATAYLHEVLDLPQVKLGGSAGWVSGGSTGIDIFNPSPTRKVLCGITLRGLKKKAANTFAAANHRVLLSYAAFDPKSRELLAWSEDVKQPTSKPRGFQALRHTEHVDFFPFDAAQLKRFADQARLDARKTASVGGQQVKTKKSAKNRKK